MKRAGPESRVLRKTTTDEEEDAEVLAHIRGSQILDLRNATPEILEIMLRTGVTKQELEDPERVRILLRTIRERMEEEEEKQKQAKEKKEKKQKGKANAAASTSASTSAGPSGGGGGGGGGGSGPMAKVKDAIMSVAKFLEEPAKLKEIETKLGAMVQQGYHGDMELVMPDVFQVFGYLFIYFFYLFILFIYLFYHTVCLPF